MAAAGGAGSNAADGLGPVLVAAIKRQAATRFRAPDANRQYLEVSAELLQAGVCPRCLLRLSGHKSYADYRLLQPEPAELLQMLQPRKSPSPRPAGTPGAKPPSASPDPPASPPASASAEPGQQPPCSAAAQPADGSPSVPRAGATAAAPYDACVVCMGLMQLLSAPADVVGSAPDAAASPAPPPVPEAAESAAAPAAGVADPDGSGATGAVDEACAGARQDTGVDLADPDPVWTRIKQRALPPSAGGGAPPPAASASPVPSLDIACLAPALGRLLHQRRPAVPPMLADPSLSSEAAAQAGSSSGNAQQGDGLAGAQFEFKSLGVEIGALPAACAVREAVLHAHVMTKHGARGLYRGWQWDEVVPLGDAIRRCVLAGLCSELGKESAEGKCVPDVMLTLFLSRPGSGADVRPLAEDQLRMRQQQRQHQHQRGGKRARREPAGAKETPAAAADAPPCLVSDAELEALKWQATAEQAGSVPRHVLLKLYPWPLPPPAQAQAQAQAPEAPPEEAAGGAAKAGSGCCAAIKVTRAPLLLAGRYLKLVRHLPQCPWFNLATGRRIGGVSVQEHIERFVLPAYGCREAKMVTGGREDADVRMLGSGRPFVLELAAPRVAGHPSEEVLREVERRMEESRCGAAVRCLAPCDRSALDAIKAAEDSKEKTYRALCWSERPLDGEGADLAALKAAGRVTAEQDTPVRVLHRRAPKVRPRWLQVEAAEAVPGQPHYFSLTLRTQAGAYVKEFCHGDFGRCRPSVGDLLGGRRVEIVQLDVLDVHLDAWP